MKRIYFVTFNTRDSVNVNHFFMNVMASTAKEAVQEAKRIWSENGFGYHQFRLYAHRSSIQIVECLKIITWCGDTYRGQDAMNYPYCTSYDHR